MSTPTITPKDLNALFEKDEKPFLIDVRTPGEFLSAHATPALSRPLDMLDAKAIAEENPNGPEAPVYVLCQGGSRGEQGCKKLSDAGHPCAINVTGGTSAWAAAGLDMVKSDKGPWMPLDAQMRLVAGSLVVLGVVLSLLIHPGFVGLSAFVGCGLMFSALTGCCPMLSMLAKMPWNATAEVTCAVKK